MPRIFLQFTFIFFTLTALSGAWMRISFFNETNVIPYTNVMHGHSHLAILGWAFLGGFVVFLSLFWKNIKEKKQATILTFALFITSLFMFSAFLYEGYGVYSIILSSSHIFIEYWAAFFVYRQLASQSNIPKAGISFIIAGLVALVISSIGPFSLGYISANGLKDSYLFDMAMYFYLHFQYNGWLTLFLLGIFIIIVHEKNISIQTPLLKVGFWVYFISLFPSYFLSVLWIDLGEAIVIFATIGGIGQCFGILLVLGAFMKIWKDLIRTFPNLTITCLKITFMLLFFKSTLELGLISPTLASQIYDTRSIVIGYLHLTLLGFVSVFILTQYLMMNLLQASKIAVYGFITFFIGFFLNELLLFSQGLFEWVDFARIPFYTEGLLVASILLLIGVINLWFART